MSKTPPRPVPCWEDYFLSLAVAVSARSKDPHTQVGCVIVDHHNRVLSTGYNGPPPGVNDAAIDWSRPNKYDWVLHAEENAILHSPHPNLEGATLYVTGFPCAACMRRIAAKRIGRVVYRPMNIAMMTHCERILSESIACAAGVEVQEWRVIQ